MSGALRCSPALCRLLLRHGLVLHQHTDSSELQPPPGSERAGRQPHRLLLLHLIEVSPDHLRTCCGSSDLSSSAASLRCRAVRHGTSLVCAFYPRILYIFCTNYTFSYIASTSSPTLVPRSAKEKSVPSLLDVVKDSSSSEPSSTSPQTHIALLRTALLELISKASSAQLPHVVTEAILALIWSAPPIFDATTRGSKGNTSAVAAPSPLTSTSDVFVSGAPRTSISGSLSTAPPGSDNRYVE